MAQSFSAAAKASMAARRLPRSRHARSGASFFGQPRYEMVAAAVHGWRFFRWRLGCLSDGEATFLAPRHHRNRLKTSSPAGIKRARLGSRLPRAAGEAGDRVDKGAPPTSRHSAHVDVASWAWHYLGSRPQTSGIGRRGGFALREA